MNVTDQLDVEELIRNPQTRNEKLLVEFIETNAVENDD